jgi:pilus assembly protein CpaE
MDLHAAAQAGPNREVASATTLTIVIASLDPDVQRVTATLRDEGILAHIATSAQDAAAFLAAASPRLLVLDSGFPEHEALKHHEHLQALSDLPILFVGYGPNDAARATWSISRLEECIAKPVVAAVLALRIKALALQAGFDLPKASATARMAIAAAEPAGSLIAVYGAKGGAGKSTISVNVAVCLSQSFQRRVLLADVDLWYGDIGVMLNVNSEKSLFDICTGNEVDLFGLAKAVVPHSLGLSLLLRPSDPRQVDQVNCATVARTLKTYCALYDFVLADTGPTLDDINIQVLEAADQILLVTTPELPSIHNCARFLELAKTLGYFDKVRLVVNRANSGVDVAALQQTLGLPMFGRIVSSGKLVVEAANRGTSVFALDPDEHNQFTQDVVALTEHLVGEARHQPERFALPPVHASRRLRWPRFLRRAAA